MSIIDRVQENKFLAALQLNFSVEYLQKFKKFRYSQDRNYIMWPIMKLKEICPINDKYLGKKQYHYPK